MGVRYSGVSVKRGSTVYRNFFLVHVRVMMAVLVNASIYDSTCSKALVPWTVHCVEDERLTLGVFFETADRSDETTQPSARSQSPRYDVTSVMNNDNELPLHVHYSQTPRSLLRPHDYD